MTLTISSRQNPWFKRLRDALREHRDEVAVEGPKQVEDALAAGWSPIALIYRTEAPGRRSQEIAFSAELFDQIADVRSPQHVIGLFHRPHASLEEVLKRRDAVLVALDAVQDPGNVGTIIRLAAAFDCAGIVLLPGCADAFAPKAIRASAGAALNVPIAAATADDLIATKLPLYAADAGGENMPVPPDRAIMIFGNEGQGVSDVLRSASTLVAIPMSSRVESLNVASSAAILLAGSYAARISRSQ